MELSTPPAEAPTNTSLVPAGNAMEVPDEEEAVGPHDQLREALADYWATKPTSECIATLKKKEALYYNYVNATGKMALWRLSFEQYNRGYLTIGSVSRGGLEGELINFPVNEFRNVIDHVMGLTLEEKLALEAQPTNNDYSTNAQMTLAENLLAYYTKHKEMGVSTEHSALNAYLFGEGSVMKLWDANIGDIKLVDTAGQRIYRKGDVTFTELNPTDLIRDIHVKNFKDNLWLEARLFVNKYELAAAYPEKSKAIVQRSTIHDWDNTRMTIGNDTDSDLVPLYMFFYKPTAALPFGRQIFFIDQDLWLEDGMLEDRDIPIYTMMPSPTESINFGYTTAFDLLPLQQMLDILNSAIATNNVNFATTNILVPDNCNLGVADIIGSMNLLKYNPNVGKPEPLNLVLTPQEVYAFRDSVQQRMEVLAGINSTIRGQAEENLASGAALALKASQAIHFNSNFQRSYVTFVGELATGVIQSLQDHPNEKRTGLIAGKSNRAYLKSFYGKDLNQIDRIVATVGSAFVQTDAGKLQMAQDLISSGIIKNVQEYIEVLKTGSVEPLLEGQHKQMMRIKQENEILGDGGTVKAAMTDDHVTDILEHANVISDPAVRNSDDPNVVQVVQNTLNHISEHIELLSKMNPILAAILKQPVLNQGAPPPPGTHPNPPPATPSPSASGRPALPPRPGAPGTPGAPRPVPKKPPVPARRKVAIPAAPGAAPIALPKPAEPPNHPQGVR